MRGLLYIFPTPLYTRVSCGRASISAVDNSSMRFLRVCDCICWRTRTSCCSANCALLWISCRSCWSFSLGIDILCGCCLWPLFGEGWFGLNSIVFVYLCLRTNNLDWTTTPSEDPTKLNHMSHEEGQQAALRVDTSRWLG
jgi:hypothetical protein